MKKIFKYVAVVAIVAVAGVTAYNVQMDELQMSSLAMDNIEAIANGENSDEGTLYGNSLGTRFCCCPGSNSCGAADCSNC